MNPFTRLAVLSLVTLSSACGSGGGGDPVPPGMSNPPNDPPAAPVVSIGWTTRQLTFSWASVPGATSYRLLRNPDGASGFTQVGADLSGNATGTTLDVAVHRHDWAHALYRVDACGLGGCSASTPVGAAAAMLQTIGYLKADNAESFDHLGFALAVSADGNTLAASAIGEANLEGAVYLFVRNGAHWIQQAYLKSSNVEAGDQFGFALALSADGEMLAVGAIGESSRATGVDGDQTNNDFGGSGAVYLFQRGSTGQWSQQAYVKASNTGTGDSFGASLALSADGDTLAVGALFENSNARGIDGDQSDDTASSAGAVYVFSRDAGQIWSQQAYVKGSNTDARDEFGSGLSLSADGNTLAVGAFGEDSRATGVGGDQNDNLASHAGAAYVFTRAAGQWSQQAYVKSSLADPDDAFGFSLALSGDGNTLAVSAPGEASRSKGVGGVQSDNNAPDAGAAYVFTRTAGVWSQQAYVKASNTETLDRFGFALALSADGSTLAVGAFLEDGNAQGIDGDQANNDSNDAGAAYVFARAGTKWSQQAYVKAPNMDSSDAFARSFALSADGGMLVVGATGEASNATIIGGDQTNNDAPEAGAAYVF
jgi:hypothetical protein